MYSYNGTTKNLTTTNRRKSESKSIYLNQRYGESIYTADKEN